MKNLLYILIIGCILWIVSEIFEIVSSGFGVPGLLITIAAFLLVAIGVWSIHKQQAPKKNTLSLIGVLMLMVSLIIFAIISTQMMIAMLSNTTHEYVEGPLFITGAALVSLGSILMGVSVIRIKYFPQWTGIPLIVLPIVTILVEALSLPIMIQNLVNILLASVLIFMSFYSLKQLKSTT